MRNKFSGFYDLSENKLKEIWREPSTLFVFDTNVLLGLYRYGKKTRKDFFNLVKGTAKDTIWLPYHVALEYQRNRQEVIRKEEEIFDKILKYLEKIRQSVKPNEFKELKIIERFSHIQTQTEQFHKKLHKEIEDYEKLLKKENQEEPYNTSTDKIRKELEQLFSESKIGEIPTQDWLDRIYAEGKERYKNKIPPGYEDEQTKANRENFTYSGLNYIPMYGDLIIWNQILDKAKDPNITSIILICDDIKEDWQHIVYDTNNKKNKFIKGARAELREEIFRESDIENFTILTTFDFMNIASSISATKATKESLSEVKKLFNEKVFLELAEQSEKKWLDALKNEFDVNKNNRQKSLGEYLKSLNDLYAPSPKISAADQLLKDIEKMSKALSEKEELEEQDLARKLLIKKLFDEKEEKE